MSDYDENSGGMPPAERPKERNLLSPEATRAVLHAKTLVYLVLVVAGLGVGLGAYRYTRNGSRDDFLFSVSNNRERISSYELTLTNL